MLVYEQLIRFLATYGAFAFGIAGAIYAGITWFGKHHLSQDAKESLTLWLWGEYDSKWSHHFCNLFDAVFGRRHLSWQCFIRSSVASLLAVMVLYILFAEILGVMDERAHDDLNFWEAVLFGAAINIVPDYLSLFETRWLLRRFEHVRSIAGQLGVLFADALFTGAIIWLCINAFRFISGDTALSVIEILGLFSVFALFFYSTVLTSVWAWLYCLSTWIMRLFSHRALKSILDVENKPMNQVALVSSALFLIAALVLTPVLRADDTGRASRFDHMLCSIFGGVTCLHIIHLTPEESEAVRILSEVCERTEGRTCYDLTESYYKGDEAKASGLWRKACKRDYALGCNNLGYMFSNGLGVARDDAKAVSLYRQACTEGYAPGCSNLGRMHADGRGVEQNFATAVSFYRQACTEGYAPGCSNLASLGERYASGDGVEPDFDEAVRLFQLACDEGDAGGCSNLGVMYEIGDGVEQDFASAVSLYRQSCDGGVAQGCSNLGWMYERGLGVEQNGDEALSRFLQACDMGLETACADANSNE